MIKNKVIGMIGDYPPRLGGVATHVKEIVNILSIKNKIILIVPSQISSFEVRDKVEIHRVKRIQRKYFTMLTTTFFPLRKAFYVRNRVDLFHCHGFFSGVIGYVTTKIPLVITVHGIPTLESAIKGRIKENSPQFKLLRMLEKKTAKRADAIIAVDSVIENWLNVHLNVPKEKLFCIPNGVNINEFSTSISGEEIRKKYGIKEDEKLIVIIRKFTPKNGVDVALDAFILLIRKYGFRNVKLLLAGGGELKEKFARILKESNMESSVILEDAIPHSQVPKYFASADIIINTFTRIPGVKEFEVSSLFEALEQVKPIGTSITTLEAMASGKTTVVSAVGGRFEDVSPDNVGILTPNDPEILADALSKLLNDEKLIKKMGVNGRNYIEKKRSWNTIIEKISEAYNFAISRR